MENNLPKHDCKQFVKQVFLVLDGEMSESEQHMFIADIERCKHCLDHYKIEKDLKAYVSKSMERKCCSEGLKQSIISQIQSMSAEKGK